MDPATAHKNQERINELKNLVDFFKHPILSMISVKTESICELADDTKVDGDKIELFHVQYTDSLINLLRKIRNKWVEDRKILEAEKILLLQTYETYDNLQDTDTFDVDRKYHNSHLKNFFKEIYENLTVGSPVLTTINSFSDKYSDEYYHNDEVEYVAPEKYYESANFKISRKLIGNLKKFDFKVKFICGFKKNHYLCEIVKTYNDEEMIIIDYANKVITFYEGDKVLIKNGSTKVQKKYELELKIKENARLLKDSFVFTEDIERMLKEYDDRIGELKMRSQHFNYDEETNILRAMLNYKPKK